MNLSAYLVDSVLRRRHLKAVALPGLMVDGLEAAHAGRGNTKAPSFPAEIGISYQVENEFEKLDRRSKATSSAMLCASKLICVLCALFMEAIS